jgi:PiT family inorganic phosphate transporter
MTDIALDPGKAAPPRSHGPNLDQKFDLRTAAIFVVIMVAGLGYTAWSLFSDVETAGAPVTTYWASPC